MTAFIIALIVVCIAQLYIVNKKTTMRNNAARQKKNIEENYDFYMESLSKEYRTIASKYNIQMLYGYNKEDVNIVTKISHIKEICEEKYHTSRCYEAEWLCIVGKACGKLNSNFVSYIYTNNLWEDMPISFTNEYAKQFKIANRCAIDSKNLSHYLKCACLIKSIIISDEDYGFYSKYYSAKVMSKLNEKYGTNACAIDRLVNQIIKKNIELENK